MQCTFNRILAMIIIGTILITGIPHPVSGAALRTGNAWSPTIVDHGSSTTSGPSFADPEIAIDPYGHPWISYTANDGTLKLASKIASIWNLQTVDSRSSTGWSSLAINNSGIPQISYQSKITQLSFTRGVSSPWSPQEIDFSNPGSGRTGDESSIDLDSKGTPFVAYINNIDNAKGDLWVTYATGAAWNKSKLDGVLQRNPTLKIDKNDHPRIGYISYDDKTSKNILRYRSWDGSAWIVRDWTPGCSDCLSQAAMAIDSSGNPYFIFMDDSSLSNPKVEVAHNNGSAWTVQDVDIAQIYRPSIAVDQNGYPQVCYFDMGKSIQKFAGWDGTHWTIEPVFNTDGGDCSIALDAGSGVHIAYVDHSRRLIYAGKPSGSASHKVFLAFVKQPG